MPGFEGYELWHNENGSITFQCTPTRPGTYKIAVEHEGVPLEGLPVCCVVKVAGEGYVTAYKAGNEADLDIDFSQSNEENALPAIEHVDEEPEQITPEAFPEEDQDEEEIPKPDVQDIDQQLESTVSVAMEIPDDALPEEIADIKPIVDLGIEIPEGIPGNTKFILEKAPTDPEDPNGQTPVYILKEHGEEMNIIFEQTQEPMETQEAVASVIESIDEPHTIPAATPTITMYMDNVETPQSHSGFRTIEMPSMYTESPRSSRRTPGRRNAIEVDSAYIVKPKLKDIPKEVLNPGLKKIVNPILIGPGQNTKATFLRKMTPSLTMTKEQVSAVEEAAMAWTEAQAGNTVPVDQATTIWEPTEVMMIQEGGEQGAEANMQPENAADAAAWLDHVIGDAPEALDQSEQPGTEGDAAVSVKQEPLSSVNSQNDVTDDEQPSTSTAEQPSPTRVSSRISARRKCAFRCRKPNCDQSFSNKKELDEHSSTHTEAMFVCPVLNCKRIFVTEKFFRTHTRSAHKEEDAVVEEDLVPCIVRLCVEKFQTTDIMREHVQQDHTEKERQFMCKVCWRMCGNKFAYEQHMEIHNDNGHKCKEPDCEKVFRNKRQLDMHMTKHVEGVYCSPCQRPFSSKEKYEKHLSRVHGEGPLKQDEFEINEEGKVICPICQKGFTSKVITQKHITSVHGDEKHPCPVCNSTFKTKENLKRHIKTHDDAKPFMCDTCGDFFKTKDILRCHRVGMHRVQQVWEVAEDSNTPVLVEKAARPFVCKYCDRTFKRKAVLKEHLAIHESVIDVPCSHAGCSKTFPTITLMKTHVRAVHKHRNRGVVCTQEGCGKIFKTPSALQVHLNGTHLNLRFQCVAEGCDFTFTTKHHMLSHYQLKHTNLDYNYACSICEKRFRLKEQVKAHLDVHKADRPHECESCGKTFATRSRLTAHLKIHKITGEHICFHCGKAFVRKYRLQEHLKKHTEVAVAYTVV